MNYWLKWFLPGLFLILLAFWAGTMESVIFSLAGFLSFFTVGVTLIIEGKRKTRDPRLETEDSKQKKL